MSASEKANRAPKRAGVKWELWGFVSIVFGICVYPASVNLSTAFIAGGFVVFIIGRFK
jgi:hypothetical protein